MAHIFISYKHENADFAAMLVQQLEASGFIAWIDRNRLRAGEDWRAAIDKAIRESFALIVIMTPEAKASEYVTYEWACAIGMGVKVVPLLLERTALHPRLEVLQHLDFTDYERRPWEQLVRQLEEFERDYVPTAVADTLNAPPVIREAILALDSPNADTRRSAVLKLSRMNHRAARAALSESVLLRDPDWQVRVTALEALGQFTEGRAPQAVINALHDTVSYVREAAVRAIGQIKDASAIPALLELIDASAIDSVREVRELEHVSKAVTEVLRGFGAAAIEYLDEIARTSGKPYQRLRVAKALGYVGYSGVPVLIRLLDDPEREVCATAVRSLERVGDRSAGTALIAMLRGDDRELRSDAMRALVAVRDPNSVPHIITALQDPDDTMRELAATALGIFADRSAVDELALALRDPVDAVREAALAALSRMPDPLAIPALLECARNYPSEEVLTVLAALNTPEICDDLIAMLHAEGTGEIYVGAVLHTDEPGVIAISAVLLGEQRAQSAVPDLIPLLQHHDAVVRSVTAHALGSIGDPEVTQSLAAAFLREPHVAQGKSSRQKLGSKAKQAADGTRTSDSAGKWSNDDPGFSWFGDYSQAQEPHTPLMLKIDVPEQLRRYYEDSVRQAIINALARLNTDESACELVNCLWHVANSEETAQKGDFDLETLMKQLAVLKRPSALERLFTLLRSVAPDELPDLRLRNDDDLGELTRLVMEIVSPNMEAALVTAAADPHPLVRLCAAAGFAKLRISAPLEAIMRADPLHGLREFAAASLFKIGWLPANRADRVAAALATRNYVDCIKLGADTVPGLIELLDVSDGGDLDDVIQVLGKIGDRRALLPLIGVVFSNDPFRATETANDVLSQFEPDSMKLIDMALTSEDVQIRNQVALKLVKNGSIEDESTEIAQRFSPLVKDILLDILRHGLPDQQAEAARAAGELHLDAAVPLLFDLLRAFDSPAGHADQYAARRSEVMFALAELEAEEIVEEVLPLINHQDVFVRAAAANTLIALEWEPEDDAGWAKLYAAASLWGDCVKVGTPAIPVLIALLRDPLLAIRALAAETLAQIGDPSALPALLQALHDLPEEDGHGE